MVDQQVRLFIARISKRLVELSGNRLTVARDFSPRCSITLVGRCTHIGALPTKAARIDLDPETSTQDAFRPAGLISCVACFGSQSILAFLRSPIQDRASLRFVGSNLLAEIWIASLLKTVVDQRIRFPLLEIHNINGRAFGESPDRGRGLLSRVAHN